MEPRTRRLRKPTKQFELDTSSTFTRSVTKSVHRKPTNDIFRCSDCLSTRFSRNGRKIPKSGILADLATGQALVGRTLCLSCGRKYLKSSKGAVNDCTEDDASLDKEEYLKGAKDRAMELAAELGIEEGGILYCGVFTKCPCACIEAYLGEDPHTRPNKARFIIDLHEEARRLTLLKYEGADPDGKRGRTGWGNGQKKSLRFSAYVAEKRSLLREDLGLCEKMTQQILCYSNSFLHRRLKTEANERRVERSRGQSELGILIPIHQLSHHLCCTSTCSHLVNTHPKLVERWRHRAEMSRESLRQVIAEMLLPSGGRTNCHQFITMVTGCYVTTIEKVRQQGLEPRLRRICEQDEWSGEESSDEITSVATHPVTSTNFRQPKIPRTITRGRRMKKTREIAGLKTAQSSQERNDKTYPEYCSDESYREKNQGEKTGKNQSENDIQTIQEMDIDYSVKTCPFSNQQSKFIPKSHTSTSVASRSLNDSPQKLTHLYSSSSMLHQPAQSKISPLSSLLPEHSSQWKLSAPIIARMQNNTKEENLSNAILCTKDSNINEFSNSSTLQRTEYSAFKQYHPSHVNTNQSCIDQNTKIEKLKKNAWSDQERPWSNVLARGLSLLNKEHESKLQRVRNRNISGNSTYSEPGKYFSEDTDIAEMEQQHLLPSISRPTISSNNRSLNEKAANSAFHEVTSAPEKAVVTSVATKTAEDFERIEGTTDAKDSTSRKENVLSVPVESGFAILTTSPYLIRPILIPPSCPSLQTASNLQAPEMVTFIPVRIEQQHQESVLPSDDVMISPIFEQFTMDNPTDSVPGNLSHASSRPASNLDRVCTVISGRESDWLRFLDAGK